MARGTPSIQRVHARNYIQKEADLRLKEVTRPYQQQGLNALGVDAYEVFLFLKKMSSTACTCREVQTVVQDVAAAPTTIVRTGISETNEIDIDWKRPLFGEHQDATAEQDDDHLSDYEFDDDEPVTHQRQLIESSADCGICYRTGFVPGLEQYGKRRIVLTTHDLVDVHSYTINRGLAPHVFERLHPSGYVEFEFTAPKYFKSVSYSIRDNTQLTDSTPYLQSGPLDAEYLRMSGGNKIRVRVNAESFTHLVFTFDLGTDPIYANIAQLSRATDWTLFSTIGNLNVILPMTIPELTNGSIIVVPKVGLTLTVTDTTYLRTAEVKNLDWSVNTRVCQPQESTTRIAKEFKLF